MIAIKVIDLDLKIAQSNDKNFFKQKTFSSGVSEIDTHKEEGKKVQEKGMSRRVYVGQVFSAGSEM